MSETVRDFTAELFFASALRAGADCSLTRLLPLADQREPLAPHERFAQRMLLALYALRYIEPELSLSWAQDWLYSRDWLSKGFESVSWRVLRPVRPTNESLIAWSGGIEVAPATLEACAAVWEDLALAETATYARWSLAEAGFNPELAQDAAEALSTGLRSFSVEQMMYLVHIALRSLALAHQRGGTQSNRPGRVFATALFTYVQRAASERWKIRGMTRPLSVPRSAIATLFSDVVTRLGNRYYSDRPCVESLAN